MDDPDFDEMQTTTLRNRSAKPKKPSFGGRKAPPFQRKQAHMDKFADYEGTPQDEEEDRRGARRMGMSKEEYEGTPEDEAEDMRGMKKMGPPKNPPSKGGGAKGAHGMHVVIAIAPMSNPAAEHRDSIRNSINKSISQIKRRK